jgi:hypothetical protein
MSFGDTSDAELCFGDILCGITVLLHAVSG